MKSGAPSFRRRSILLAAVGILALVLTACRGVGGGQLPPSTGFTGPASFGFTFSCEDKGGLNPPTGKLSIELAYAERGTYSYVGSSVIGSSFSIHGIVDQIDPVVESAVCIDQNPPPVPGTLTFLGRWRLTSSAPAGFPSTCPTRETKTTPLCRFEVTVQDNDQNLAPSPGDFFSIRLSSVPVFCGDPIPDPRCSQLPAETVFYARAGYLSGGNITVK
jgi:hypothetical protein